MPKIQSRLREIFGPLRLEISHRGDTIIAEGAAWFANDGRRLTLAKNTKLLVSGSSHFPIIKAGTLMPLEGETNTVDFSLYCTDPRDGIAKIQLCSPLRPGKPLATDERRVLDNLSIKVDAKADPFFERISFEGKIDHNLILTASAESLMTRSEDYVEIHDLEFGLEIRDINSDSRDQTAIADANRGLAQPPTAGSVNLKPNTLASEKTSSARFIPKKEHWALVPGELMGWLAKSQPFVHGHYFEPHLRPPNRQVQEKLYYKPCALCHRAINDPLCNCNEIN